MQRVADQIKERMQKFRERGPLSPAEEASWEEATHCHLCGKEGMTAPKFKTGAEKPVKLKKDGAPYKVQEPKNVLLPVFLSPILQPRKTVSVSDWRPR